VSDQRVRFVGLKDVSTIRLKCKGGCQGVTEIDIKKIPTIAWPKANTSPLTDGYCPVCKANLNIMGAATGTAPPVNWLVQLAEAVAALEKADQTIEVSFVLPKEG
jgi:hypothetical protein